jgi:tetratricopeptide (TPR) repeat protein
MDHAVKNRWIAAGLFALAAALYIRTVGFPFVLYDDNLYVFENPQVLNGLSPGGLAWAFSGFHVANWHPLTWVSHMLDVDLFGPAAWGPHLMNVLIHALATTVLFLALNGMTGSPARSAVVAALFAVHPLHVESVAWVSERKDVLCGLFFVAAMAAYGRYAAAPSGRRLLAVVLASALSLLSKPVAVTLPFVFLLLDIWPLGRLQRGAIPRLLLEKAPLFILSALVVGLTAMAQGMNDGIADAATLPIGTRLASACIAYAEYLRMTAWPASLAVIYPHPASVHQAIPALRVAFSVALLAGITIAAALNRRRRPWLLVGWLWFLGTLVPMIGLVQVGAQLVADRYMYLPSIGLFLAATWEVADRVRGRERAARFALPAALLVVALFAGCAWKQIGYWKDSEALFLRAADTAPEGNWNAEFMLGIIYQREGRLADARRRLDRSLRIKPDFPPARLNMGIVLAGMGDSSGAVGQIEEAIRQAPDYFDAHLNLGLVLMGFGKKAEAAESFRKALAVRPGDPTAASMLAAASS